MGKSPGLCVDLHFSSPQRHVEKSHVIFDMSLAGSINELAATREGSGRKTATFQDIHGVVGIAVVGQRRRVCFK